MEKRGPISKLGIYKGPHSRKSDVAQWSKVVKKGKSWSVARSSPPILLRQEVVSRTTVGSAEDAMFRGNHPARVDEKGRLKLPADFKSLLPGNSEEKQLFYITSKDGKRAEIWPLKAWEDVEARLAGVSNLNPVKAKFLDVTSYYGSMVEMDGQGRLLIPQVLRDAAKVGNGNQAADVVVFGKQVYLEVANREVFEAELKAAPLRAEDLAALADLGV